MSRAVVLLSGGQDSTVCLYWARERFAQVYALSIDYGQRHSAELEAAARIARLAGVPHETHSLHALKSLGDSALVAGAEIRASGGYADREAPNGLPTSFVPGRNILFFATAAALAVKLGTRDIVSGVCQTDYSGYPDCRRAFVDAFETAATLGMPSGSGPVMVHTPLMYLTKRETVVISASLPGCWAALAESVTCYEGLRPGCGVCPACVLRASGFAEAGRVDPASA